jgi:hypothetical protein
MLSGLRRLGRLSLSNICPCGIAREDCDYHKSQSQPPIIHCVGTMFSTLHVRDAAKLNNFPLLRVHAHTALFNRMCKNGLLNTRDGIHYLENWYVSSGLEYSFPCKIGGLFDTLLTFEDGGRVILRTREH